jgi:polyisoprenoid-binding protein YceI
MKRTDTLTKIRWEIDPAHSEFSFKVKHLMITWVRGVFRDVLVEILTEGNDFSSAQIEVRINAASLNTGDQKRDAHLKSADFFDVERHRELIFRGENFEKTGEDRQYVLYGTLSIKGITKPVKFDVEYLGTMKDPYGNEKAGFTAEGSISRKLWELNWNQSLEEGGVLVGDEVKVNCEFQLVKQT